MLVKEKQNLKTIFSNGYKMVFYGMCGKFTNITLKNVSKLLTMVKARKRNKTISLQQFEHKRRSISKSYDKQSAVAIYRKIRNKNINGIIIIMMMQFLDIVCCR